MARDAAPAYFHHNPVSKATQPSPYRAAAHARYIQRKAAVTRVFTENMPLNWHAQQRFLKRQEDALRKNGRVCDKFIIAVPREFTQDQAEILLRRYGRRIGKGRTPFMFAFHWDEHNPHAHGIFIDRDIETGKRVFGTSELNSTARLKIEWESEVNAFMAELGLSTRIEFGPQQKQAENDNLRPSVSEQLPTSLDTPAPTADIPAPIEDADDSADDDMAALDIDADPLHPSDIAKFIIETQTEKASLERLIERRSEMRTAYSRAYAEASTAIKRHSDAHVALNQAGLDVHAKKQDYTANLRITGSARGFRVAFGGFEWKSPARRRAEETKAAYEAAKHAEKQAAYELEQLAYYSKMKGEEAASLREAAEALQRQLSVYGTDQEIADALDAMQRGIDNNLERLPHSRLVSLYEEGEVTYGEVVRILEMQGKKDLAAEWIKEHGKDNSLDL